MPQLAVVTAGQPLPEPPYPAEIKARGWAFELDYETIEQSSTWKLAGTRPEVRPWLLMLWYESWKQHPIGTLPNNDQLIAAIIGCSNAFFLQHREVLMRGWELHSDGLLYHPTVTKRVYAMIGKRQKDAVRQAKHRSMPNQGDTNGVTRDSRVSNDGVAASPSPPPLPIPFSKDESPTDSSARPVDRAPACPHERIIELWNRVMVTSPKVDADRWHENHRRPLRTRWREVWEYEGKKGRARDTEALLLWWERLFRFCRESKFLMGQVPGRDGGPPFELTLPYLIGPKNLYRVISGEFHREGGKGR